MKICVIRGKERECPNSCPNISIYEDQNCDSVQNPGRKDEWAGEYGLFMIPSLARTRDGVTTVYFVMSIWNPYAVMLMKTDLSLVSAP